MKIHLYPHSSTEPTACCGIRPVDLSRGDVITTDEELVTCKGFEVNPMGAASQYLATLSERGLTWAFRPSHLMLLGRLFGIAGATMPQKDKAAEFQTIMMSLYDVMWPELEGAFSDIDQNRRHEFAATEGAPEYCSQCLPRYRRTEHRVHTSNRDLWAVGDSSSRFNVDADGNLSWDSVVLDEYRPALDASWEANRRRYPDGYATARCGNDEVPKFSIPEWLTRASRGEIVGKAGGDRWHRFAPSAQGIADQCNQCGFLGVHWRHVGAIGWPHIFALESEFLADGNREGRDCLHCMNNGGEQIHQVNHPYQLGGQGLGGCSYPRCDHLPEFQIHRPSVPACYCGCEKGEHMGKPQGCTTHGFHEYAVEEPANGCIGHGGPDCICPTEES